jgi:putative nucleotidyltransferase with HDIG domain
MQTESSSQSGSAGTILVVDDEEGVRRVIDRYLTREGHDVVLAASGEEALNILAQRTVACMLLDINMPEQRGTDILPAILDAHPTLSVIMVTGLADGPTAAWCMRAGVVDYLTKPLDLEQLGAAVQRALQAREEAIARLDLEYWLKETVAERTREIHEERRKLELLAASALESLAMALEAKDPYMAGHSVRIAQLAASIAAEMGRTDDEVEQARHAGRLHDIGMIGVPSRVLATQGPLSDEEFAQVKDHVVRGAEFLAPYPHLSEIASFVRSHHERWDGQGYPDGLAGDQIPWGARVLAAAEVYDALTTARPHHLETVTPEEATEHMGAMAGIIIDPDVHAALARVVARRKALEFVSDEADGQTSGPADG